MKCKDELVRDGDSCKNKPMAYQETCLYKYRRRSLIVIVEMLHLRLIAYASNMSIAIRSSMTLSDAPLACSCVAYL